MVPSIAGQRFIQARQKALLSELETLETAQPHYSIEAAASYDKALAALRQSHAAGKAALQPTFTTPEGTVLARPLTFEEDLDARVNAWESGDRTILDTWNDTCSGIHYKAQSSLIKVIPLAEALITLPESFSQASVALPYEDSVGTELDVTKGKYNKPLTKREVLDHPAWCAVVQDKSLLKVFRDIVFKERETAMGFYVRESPQKDELRALVCDYLNGGCYALDRYDLDYGARFVRVSPTK